MKRTFAMISAAMVALVFCVGCGDSRESLAEDGMETMKKMVTVLKTIKDEATAKAAKPELQALADDLNDLNKRQEELGIPTEEEGNALLEKYGKEMEEVQVSFTKELLRIAFDPKIQAVLSDIDMKPGR